MIVLRSSQCDDLTSVLRHHFVTIFLYVHLSSIVTFTYDLFPSRLFKIVHINFCVIDYRCRSDSLRWSYRIDLNRSVERNQLRHTRSSRVVFDAVFEVRRTNRKSNPEFTPFMTYSFILASIVSWYWTCSRTEGGVCQSRFFIIQGCTKLTQ